MWGLFTYNEQNDSFNKHHHHRIKKIEINWGLKLNKEKTEVFCRKINHSYL